MTKVDPETNDSLVESAKPRPLAPLLVLVILVWSITGWFAWTQPDPGTFGDMFGATNALFSGLAFAALIYTMWLQRDELQLQRQELRDTREELQGQKLALESQNTTFRRQNFESTLFRAVDWWNEVARELYLTGSSGRYVIGELLGRLQQPYGNFAGSEIERAAHAFRSVYQGGDGAQLGRYFRVLYHVFSFIDRNGDLTDKEKRQYANLVRAQLSATELTMLFYNGTYGEGRSGFRPLIEKYHLLKHVPDALLLDRSHKTDPAFYSEKAFIAHRES